MGMPPPKVQDRLVALEAARDNEKEALKALSCLVLPPMNGEPPGRAELRQKVDETKLRIEELEVQIGELSNEK
jgi:hypothetical protein